MAMKNKAVGRIVGGHTNGDPVPYDHPNIEAFHLATKLC